MIQYFIATFMALGLITLRAETTFIPIVEEPTFSNKLGYFIEDVLDRNEIISKYFNTDAFLIGFDNALTNEPAMIPKEELFKYFEPETAINEERKAIFSEAWGHYVALVLKGKNSKEIVFEEVRAGIVDGRKMEKLPLISEEAKAKYCELLEEV